jgi:hypothetical protein
MKSLRAYTLVLVLRAVCYGSVVSITGLHGYMVFALSAGVLDGASTPLQRITVDTLEAPEERQVTLAALAGARNGGTALGLLMATAVVTLGSLAAYQYLFIFNGLTFVITAVFLQRLKKKRRHQGRVELKEVTVESNASPAGGGVKRRYALLVLGSSFTAVHDSILVVLIPLLVLATAHGLPALFPLLLAINTVLSFLLQVPLANRIRRIDEVSRMLPRCVGMLLIACAFLGIVDQVELPLVWKVGLLVAGVVILTVGEVLDGLGGFVTSFDLAPEIGRSGYLAMFSQAYNVQRVLGPLLITMVVLKFGSAGWFILALVIGFGGVCVRASIQSHLAQGGKNYAISQGEI